MRIAHIVGDISCGGVASVVMNYYRNIDRNEYQFDFYSYGPSPFDEEIISLGGRIFFIKRFNRPLKSVRNLSALLKAQKYTIVHSHINTLNAFALKAAKAAGVKIRIAHNHSTSAPFELKTVVKKVLKPLVKKYATHLAACSKASAKWIYGKNGENATIFNNAVNLERFTFNSAVRHELRKDLKIENKFVIGHAGRFVYQKNHEFLIKMMKHIVAKNNNAALVLAGSGKLQNKIKKITRKLKLSDNVLFLGERHDMDKLWQAFDIFVLPSHYEGLPVVAIEAQACELPVILSDKISRETAITNCTFLSLSAPLTEWADTVLTFQNSERNLNTPEIMRKAGFDIKLEAVKLKDYYDKLIGE